MNKIKGKVISTYIDKMYEFTLPYVPGEGSKRIHVFVKRSQGMKEARELLDIKLKELNVKI
jgi:hypothetical protein